MMSRHIIDSAENQFVRGRVAQASKLSRAIAYNTTQKCSNGKSHFNVILK